MKEITPVIILDFFPYNFHDLLELEKPKLIYKSSLKLDKVTNYIHMYLRIKFIETYNLPDRFQLFCFKPKTQNEKEILDDDTPGGYFTSYVDYPQLPNKNIKSNVLNLSVNSLVDFSDEGSQIERISFDFGVKNIKLKYQFFSNE